MRKIFTLAALALLTIATSCRKTKDKQEQTSAVPTEAASGQNEAAIKALAGTYKGKFPCADCPGIVSNLVLTTEKNFVLMSEYLESKDGKFIDNGTYNLADDGKHLILQGEKDPVPQYFYYDNEKIYMVRDSIDTEIRKDYEMTKE